MSRREWQAMKAVLQDGRRLDDNTVEAEMRKHAGAAPLGEDKPRRVTTFSDWVPEHREPTGELVTINGHRLLCADSRVPASVETVLHRRCPRAIVFDPPYEERGIYAYLPPAQAGQSLLLFWDVLRLGQAFQFAFAMGWQFRFEMIWDNQCVAWRRDDEPDWAHKSCGLFGTGWTWSTVLASQFMPRHANRTRLQTDRVRLSSVYKQPKSRMGGGHPHAKPDPWIAALLAGVGASGGVVFDPFLGGGSTVRACSALGARCCGIEIDPDIFAQIDHEYIE